MLERMNLKSFLRQHDVIDQENSMSQSGEGEGAPVIET
jgi:hypothetical protein